jgi:6-phosphogluconolactonase
MRPPTVHPDADALAAAVAALVADALGRAPALRLVLAGGTTPLPLYRRLAAAELAWGRATILFGDERCLPARHPETNFQLASDALLAAIAPLSVHRIPGELGPDAAAAAYAPLVAAGPLDLVLLGVGQDGHTASLFPGNPALTATGPTVGVRGSPKPPPERVSLTLEALRAARRVVILAAGADKRDAVRAAAAGTVPAGQLPHAEWHLTADAAG